MPTITFKTLLVSERVGLLSKLITMYKNQTKICNCDASGYFCDWGPPMLAKI